MVAECGRFLGGAVEELRCLLVGTGRRTRNVMTALDHVVTRLRKPFVQLAAFVRQ